MDPREAIAEFAGADRWSDHDHAIFMGLLDNYARSLADQQRAWANTFGNSSTQHAIKAIVHEAADRIDPDKKGNDG